VKICAFWQLLLDRIQTKDNLVKRRIVPVQQSLCVLCGSATETASHLFLHCNFAGKVWYDIIRWLGVIVILPHNILSSLAVLISCAKNKKERAGLCLIWNAYVWVIWCGRNDCIFNSGAVSIEDVTDQIKMLSWKWFIGRRAKGPCLFYEWKWSRLDCLLR
jgi:hypothetical protein